MYIVEENRTRQAIYNVHDLGFFLWILWPILVPYYFIKSRGIAGLAIFLLLLALLIMDSIVYWIWLAMSQDAA